MIEMRFGRQVTGDLGAAAAREWLVGDGLGGFAMGTVAGLRTRRYHGLLVVAGAGVPAPGGRRLALAAVDPVVVIGDRRFELAVHEWADGTVAPDGYVHLESFSLRDGLPVWRWSLGDVVIERELALVRGRPAVGVVHRLVRSGAAGPVRLELDVLGTWRDIHGERFAGPDPGVELVDGGFVFEAAWRMRGPGFEPAGAWYRGARHRAEAERGLYPLEDLWHCGRFVATLAPGEEVGVEAWAGGGLGADSTDLDGGAGTGAGGGLALPPHPPPPSWVRPGSGPPRWPAGRGPTTTSIASCSHPRPAPKEPFGPECLRRSALTWMDARVDGTPVTGRHGKPVEVNALWINGLAAIAGLLGRAGADTSGAEALLNTARASFARRFVRPDGAGLFDVVDGPGGGDDASLRPNQLLAVSLPHAALDPATAAARSAVTACGPLLTSFGLRSLAPGSPGYTGRHRGGPSERDRAYHQGTVWPWLVGPWVDAAAKVGLPTTGALAGLEAHLAEWGLGSVSETADGDPPHAATGCPFQAWSVAEVLRARRRLNSLPRP